MSILNERLTFATMPRDVRKTFFGIPIKVFLHAGTDLYRFLSPPGSLVESGPGYLLTDAFFSGNRVLSECFLDYETFTAIPRYARESGLTVAEVAQPALGVKRVWNPTMSEFGWIKLQKPAYAFRGPCNRKIYNSQLKSGGLDQIWLPHLTTDAAYTVGRGRVEDLTPNPQAFDSSATRLRRL